MENIRYIKLKNKGGFVAKLQCNIKENTLTNMETSAMTLNGKAGILTVTEIFAPRQNAPLTLLTQIFRTAHR